jgi:protein gp37
MNRSKIEYCRYTWNPYIGCYNKCRYCYARPIVTKRFGKIWAKAWKFTFRQTTELCAFVPTWIKSNFDKPIPKKPSVIFVNSMSDICHWDYNHAHLVMDKIIANPQHLYLFLTKKYGTYIEWLVDALPDLGENHDNLWFGCTCTCANELAAAAHVMKGYNKIGFHTWVSIEPIQDDIPQEFMEYLKVFDWVVLGEETGNDPGKVHCFNEWAQTIIDNCEGLEIPILVKEPLSNRYNGTMFNIKQYPIEFDGYRRQNG